MPFAPSLAALLLASTVSSATPADPAAAKSRNDGHARSDSHRGRHRHERASHGAKPAAAAPKPAAKPATKEKENAPLPSVPSLALSMPRSTAAASAKDADIKPTSEKSIDEHVAGLVASLGGAVPAKAPEAPPAKAPCLRAPVAIQHGHEAMRFSLTKCDGGASARAVESLSLLATTDGKASRRIDGRVVERLQLVVDHFDKDGDNKSPTVVLVAAGKDQSKGHGKARSLDFRVEGVSGEDLLSYCHTLQDTVCGYYPSSSTLHLEAREKGEGRIAYVDASGGANTSMLPSLAASLVAPLETEKEQRNAKEKPQR
jgi:hypothetical protein